MSRWGNLTFESVIAAKNIPRDNAWGDSGGNLLNNIDNLSNAFKHLSGVGSSDPFKSKLAKPEIVLEEERNEVGYAKAKDLATGGLQKITSLADKYANPEKDKSFSITAARKILEGAHNMLDPQSKTGSFYRRELQEFSKQLGLGKLKDLGYRAPPSPRGGARGVGGR